MKYFLIVLMLMATGAGWAGDDSFGTLSPELRACAVSFGGDNGTVGRIDWCDGVAKYDGDMPADKSVHDFIRALNTVCRPYELISAAEGVLPYLEGRVPSIMNCSGESPFISDNCILYVPGKEAAIQRFRDALKKAKGK